MVMMASSLAQRAATGRALAPAAAPRVFAPRPSRPVLRRFREGEQADTSEQGSKAPRNPITGQRLTPVSNPQKEGYQATEQIPQSEATSARINKQLDAQPSGRPFGGKHRRSQVLVTASTDRGDIWQVSAFSHSGFRPN